jgi:hypothetical protein
MEPRRQQEQEQVGEKIFSGYLLLENFYSAIPFITKISGPLILAVLD